MYYIWINIYDLQEVASSQVLYLEEEASFMFEEASCVSKSTRSKLKDEVSSVCVSKAQSVMSNKELSLIKKNWANTSLKGVF